MDKYLNNAEERLFDLLETTDFDQLTAEERTFVEQHLSRGEYELQRRMITEAQHAFPAPPAAGSLKFISGTGFTGKTIPLYQAIVSVAATIALFLFLWPDPEQPQDTPSPATPQLSQVDTVIQTKVVTDTVIRYIEREKHRATAPTAAISAQESIIQAAPPRVWESGMIDLPAITEELVRTKGNSLKEDTAAQTILNGLVVARRS